MFISCHFTFFGFHDFLTQKYIFIIQKCIFLTFHLLNLSDSDFQISSNKKIIFLLFHLQNLSDSDFKMSENKNTYFFLAKGANLYRRAQEKANGDEGGEIE